MVKGLWHTSPSPAHLSVTFQCADVVTYTYILASRKDVHVAILISLYRHFLIADNKSGVQIISYEVSDYEDTRTVCTAMGGGRNAPCPLLKETLSFCVPFN